MTSYTIKKGQIVFAILFSLNTTENFAFFVKHQRFRTGTKGNGGRLTSKIHSRETHWGNCTQNTRFVRGIKEEASC